MGCSASANSVTQQSSPPAQQQQQQQQAQQQPQTQPPPPPTAQAQVQPQATAQQNSSSNSNGVKKAPVLQALVALNRDKFSIESSAAGSYIGFKFDAKESGEASVYFLPKESTDKPLSFTAANTSKQAFGVGMQQQLRLGLCSKDVKSSIEGFEGEHQCVIELRTPSTNANSVVAVASYLKITAEGSASLAAQKVQRGSGAVSAIEQLFGTLPRRGLTSIEAVSDLEAEGGECVICLTNPKDVVILHCKHVCLCSSCAAITSSTWSFQCPVCRGRVAAMVQVSS